MLVAVMRQPDRFISFHFADLALKFYVDTLTGEMGAIIILISKLLYAACLEALFGWCIAFICMNLHVLVSESTVWPFFASELKLVQIIHLVP